MKAKAIILIAITAVVSLSFAFISKKESNPRKESTKISGQSKEASLGSFFLEDKL